MKCPNCTNFNGAYQNCDESIFITGRQSDDCPYYDPCNENEEVEDEI